MASGRSLILVPKDFLCSLTKVGFVLRRRRHLIEIRLGDGLTPYKIAKELKRPINTILNEIKRGTTTQIKQGKHVEMYLADTGEAVYHKNRLNSCRTMKRLECSSFINHAVDMIQNHSWSPDACFGKLDVCFFLILCYHLGIP